MCSEPAAWRITLLAVLLRALGTFCFGNVVIFLSSRRAVSRKGIQSPSREFMPRCQPLCSGWHARRHLHSLTVSFVFTTKGFCPNERWFCFHASEAIFVHKQFQSKTNTHSFSHLAYSNKLKLHCSASASRQNWPAQEQNLLLCIFSSTFGGAKHQLSWFTF